MASDERGTAAQGGAQGEGERPRSRVSELVAGTHTLALVGLAKNTGKTETLAAILREHAASDTTVGVTSIGRDGEEHDVIDARIDKPRVQLQRGSLVATTGALLRSSGVAHERLVADGRAHAAGRSGAGAAGGAGHGGSGRPERGGGPARGGRGDARAGRRAGAAGRRDRPPRGVVAGRGGRAGDGDGRDSERRHRSGRQRDARRGRPGAAAARACSAPAGAPTRRRGRRGGTQAPQAWRWSAGWC